MGEEADIFYTMMHLNSYKIFFVNKRKLKKEIILDMFVQIWCETQQLTKKRALLQIVLLQMLEKSSGETTLQYYASNIQRQQLVKKWPYYRMCYCGCQRSQVVKLHCNIVPPTQRSRESWLATATRDLIAEQPVSLVDLGSFRTHF